MSRQAGRQAGRQTVGLSQTKGRPADRTGGEVSVVRPWRVNCVVGNVQLEVDGCLSWYTDPASHFGEFRRQYGSARPTWPQTVLI